MGHVYAYSYDSNYQTFFLNPPKHFFYRSPSVNRKMERCCSILNRFQNFFHFCYQNNILHQTRGSSDESENVTSYSLLLQMNKKNHTFFLFNIIIIHNEFIYVWIVNSWWAFLKRLCKSAIIIPRTIILITSTLLVLLVSSRAVELRSNHRTGIHNQTFLIWHFEM